MRARLSALAACWVLVASIAACGSKSRGTIGPGPGTPPTAVTRTTLPVTTPAPATTTTTEVTAPPTTPKPAPPPTAEPAPKPVAGGGVAIGDSVLEDVLIYAKDTLAAKGVSINAAVSRQWKAGIDIATQLKSGGKLPPVVIVALGSNGVVTAAQFDQMMQACAGAQRVVFMTVTGPLIGNNPVITAGVARYPAAAVLADWHTLATGHPDWFAGDPQHVHIGPAGSTALGQLLASKF